MTTREKSLRLCPIRHESVCCDGLCKAVNSGGVVKLCSVYVSALDVALNCR